MLARLNRNRLANQSRLRLLFSLKHVLCRILVPLPLQVLVLPPRATVELTIYAWKACPRYREHPQDAQRGWDLPPAMFVPLFATNVSGNANRNRVRVRLYKCPKTEIDKLWRV